MIDNQEIRTNGSLTAKVSLHKALRSLEPGEELTVSIERIMYARQVASVVNISRGYKSIWVTADPDKQVVRIKRID